MLEINAETQSIFLTRGDTGYIDVIPEVKDEKTGLYVTRKLDEGDKMIFRMKVGSEILEKECEMDYDNNMGHLVFTKNDTKDLEYKTYFYEVELVTIADENFTIVAFKKFTIGKEIEENVQV